MTFLQKCIFALTHPQIGLSFLRRIIRSRILRLRYSSSHKTNPIPGVVDVFSEAILAFELPSEKTLVSEADRILAGERCIYGHLQFTVPKNTDWQRDYPGNHSWQLRYHEDIPYKYPEGVDIKNPWELSRHHHTVHVARAYSMSRDERYAKFCVQEITHWIQENPVYQGVNWKVSMEVGIRAANILLAYSLVAKSRAVTPEFTSLLLGSMAEHGDYIMNNLEIYGVKSNHYFSNLIGLLWISQLCPSLPHAKRYQEYALPELENEVNHQFLADGIGFEASLPYHRLVVEMLGFTVLLLRNRTITISNEEKLHKAISAALSIQGNSEEIPQVGDNDSGRFFVTGNYFKWNALNLEHLTSLYFQLFSLKPEKVSHYPQGGLVLIEKDTWKVALSAPPIGQDGNAGHNHDDTGSITIWHKGKAVVVDPGTGHYTSYPKIRNSFRSFEAHNAPFPLHNPPIPNQQLFAHGSSCTGELRLISNHRVECSYSIADTAFTRAVHISNDTITIEDSSESAHEQFWTFKPEAKITIKGNNCATIAPYGITINWNDELVVDICTRQYSNAYAHHCETKALHFISKNGKSVINIS